MTVNVSDVDDPVGGTNPDYKEVLVTVNWTEAGRSTPKNTQMTTYIAP